MLKTIHKEIAGCWRFLRTCERSRDTFETKLAAAEQRPIPRGRETPFFIQQSFPFAPFDFAPRTAPLVQIAESTARIVRLTAMVTN